MKKIYTCIHAQVIQNFTTLSRIEILLNERKTTGFQAKKTKTR